MGSITSSQTNESALVLKSSPPTPESRAKLIQFIKANLLNYNLLINPGGPNLVYNETSEQLCAAYSVGATAQELQSLYTARFTKLTEISEYDLYEATEDDWKETFGDQSKSRAYRDYFADKVAEYFYKWREVTNRYYITETKQKQHDWLFRGLLSGNGDSIVSLVNAYEIDNFELAVQSLSLSAIVTPEFPSYATFDERSKTVTEKLLDPSQILQNVVNDEAIKSLNEDDSSLEDLLLGYSLQLEFKDELKILKSLIELTFIIYVETYSTKSSDVSLYVDDFANLFVMSGAVYRLLNLHKFGATRDLKRRLIQTLWFLIVKRVSQHSRKLFIDILQEKIKLVTHDQNKVDQLLHFPDTPVNPIYWKVLQYIKYSQDIIESPDQRERLLSAAVGVKEHYLEH